jgi:hypothetical protein
MCRQALPPPARAAVTAGGDRVLASCWRMFARLCRLGLLDHWQGT